MPCCGKARQQLQNWARPAPGPAPGQASDAIPQRPSVARSPTYFEYTGQTGLTAVGPITGRRYRFVEPGARVAVDYRDAPSLRAVPMLRQVR